MNNELIDRYVYAVLRRLPKSVRGEIEPELRGLISDMLDERCGEITPTETDVKVVLTELGTPSELALKYDPEGERSLIGPKYFRPWLKVLTIVLAAEAGALLFGAVVGLISGEITGLWYEQLAEVIGMLWQGALSAFAIVTAIFAFLEYKKVDIDTSDDLSKLPSVPKKKETISKAECIIGIVICAILLPMLLYAPQSLLYSVSLSDSGNSAVSLFREKAFADVWYLLVIGFGAAIVYECVKLIIGRYNYRTAIASTICNIISAVTTTLAFIRTDIVSPEFVESINTALAEDGQNALTAGLANNIVGVAIAGIIIVCSVIDIIVCWVKAYIFSNNN